MAWIATVTKLAPYILQLGEIGVSALPHITRRKTAPVAPIEAKPVEADKVIPQQIVELQTAVTQNAQHIRELAISLQSAITTIEARIRRLEMIVYGLGALLVLMAATFALAFVSRL